jgi:BAR domain
VATWLEPYSDRERFITGLERLSKSMSSYTRWVGRRCDALEDRERDTPIAYFGRTMAAHGEEQEAGSDLGNALVAVGHANERISGLQDVLLEQANTSWSENLERNLAMMKEYNVRRHMPTRKLSLHRVCRFADK